MHATAVICESGSQHTYRKKRKKGKLFYSSVKELQRCRQINKTVRGTKTPPSIGKRTFSGEESEGAIKNNQASIPEVSHVKENPQKLSSLIAASHSSVSNSPRI